MNPVRKLEVCISNLELGTDDVLDKVAREFPNIELIHWGCMGYCHRCVRVPYVLLNDSEYLEAPTGAELLKKVVQRIHRGS